MKDLTPVKFAGGFCAALSLHIESRLNACLSSKRASAAAVIEIPGFHATIPLALNLAL